MKKIDSIILAGGLGTRLSGVLNGIPKALVPVNGHPFLDIILTNLENTGRIKKAIIAVGHMSDKIINEYKNSKKFKIKICFSNEHKLLGTGGALKKALKHTDTGIILVLNGDSYIDVDLNKVIAGYLEKELDITVVLKKIKNTGRFGLVKIDRLNKISSFEEKNNSRASGYINTGVYIFRKKLFSNIKPNKALSLEKEILPRFLGNKTYGYIAAGKFIDIGTPASLLDARRYFKKYARY